MPKRWILVSSDHNTFTQFSSESLANFTRACTCAFLSRGSLRALQGFSPSWRSVLPIVFWVTVVPAALRSLTRSSRVVLGWLLTVLMIIETRSDLAWSLSPREIDSYFVFLPFANKLLSPSHQAAWRWSCSPFQPCVGLQSCPLDSSLVLAMVESLESDWLIASVDRCLLYR